MRNILLALLLFVLPVGAVDMITATITLTNNPVGNTNTITVNGSTRTWTNSITASPSTLIKETNAVAIATTNLLNHLSLYPPVAGQILSQTFSTNVLIKALPGRSLTITISGGWAGIVYTTNTVSDGTIFRVPITVETATNQTNIASYVASALNLSTNAIATNAIALSNFITKGASVGPQYISTELRVSANINNGTGNLSVSNLVNSGNAIRSGGSGGNSFQAGSNALARGDLSIAIGNGAVASNTTTMAIGTGAIATNDYGMAIGNGAIASVGSDALAIGRSATATGPSTQAIGQGSIAEGSASLAVQSEVVGTNSIGIGASSSVSANTAVALGYSASVVHNNSTALGYSATTTTTNQVRIGTSAETVSIPGMLHVSGTITNATLRGTNIINGQTVYTPTANSSLANGYNSAVAVSAAYIKFSGPSAAYTNVGFSAANIMAGRRHLCQFDNPGLSLTILHDSGLDAGDTNRIYTGTGALINSTNNPAFLDIIYDTSVSRWRVVSFR